MPWLALRRRLLLLPLAGASRLRRREGGGYELDSAEDPGDLQTIRKLEHTIMGMMDHRGTPGVEEAMESMKPLITSLKDRVSTQHQNAQQLVANYQQGFEACQLLNGTLSGLSTLNEKKATHDECRGQEAQSRTELDSCQSIEANVETAANMACKTVQTLESQPNFGADTCEPVVAETYGQWLDRNEAYFKTKRQEYLQAKESCNSATANVESRTEECNVIKQAHTSKRTECNLFQSDLERATCSIGAMASSACAAYSECYSRSLTKFHQDIKVLQEQAESLQVQWKSLMRLECMVGVLADSSLDASHLEMCTTESFKADHLNLQVALPPDQASCGGSSGQVSVPCSGEWMDANYGDLPPQAPAKNCTPCPNVTMPQATTTTTQTTTLDLMNLHIQLPTAPPNAEKKLQMGHFTFKNSEIMGGAENRFDFARPFKEPPVVIILALANGGDPAVARVYDVQRTSFKAWLTEPTGGDGPAQEQQVAFLAALPGVHQLPDGRYFEVGTVSTKSQVASNDCKPVKAVDTWANLSFTHTFEKAPAFIAAIQTMANEVNAVPEAPSVPFLAVATSELSKTGAKVSLERAGAARVGQVNKAEDIGFVAMEQGTSSFSGMLGAEVTCVALVSQGIVSTTPTDVDLGAQLPTSAPLVVGGLVSRGAAEGGWLRLKAASSGWAQVFVDEDQTCNSLVSHGNESASLIACSTPFLT